jgi:hypothetical protein
MASLGWKGLTTGKFRLLDHQALHTQLLTQNKNIFISDEIVTLSRFNGNLSSDRQLQFLS